jgi:hypothetical protein
MRRLPQATSSRRVLRRFGIRLGCILALAALYADGNGGGARAAAYLAFVNALCCLLAGVLLRERGHAAKLTSWDEAAAFVLLGLVARALALAGAAP